MKRLGSAGVTDHANLENVTEGQHRELYFSQNYDFIGGTGDTISIQVDDTSYFPLLLVASAREYDLSEVFLVGINDVTYVKTIFGGGRINVGEGYTDKIVISVDSAFPGVWDVTAWSI